jgi:hypothetical protein
MRHSWRFLRHFTVYVRLVASGFNSLLHLL